MPDAQTIDSRSLDRLVAKHVFGVRDRSIGYPDYDEDRSSPHWIPSGKPWRTHQIEAEPLPRFSTDMGAAWRVAERLQAAGWLVELWDHEPRDRGREWAARLSSDGARHAFSAPTAPAAISMVALRALGVDVPAELARLTR